LRKRKLYSVADVDRARTAGRCAEGIRSGRDDYLPKPFNLAILIARVESLLRRKNWAHNANRVTADGSQQGPESPDIFRFDDKEVDFATCNCAPEKIVQLTVWRRICCVIYQNAGHPVSRKAILQDVWNLHEETDTRAIDSFIVRLRKYIEPKPSKPRYLLTIRGLGYQFVAKPQH